MRRRKQKNRNSLYLLLTLMAGVILVYLLVNVQWQEKKPAYAAITNGNETQVNDLTPTTMGQGASAKDADGNTIFVWGMSSTSAPDNDSFGVYYRRFDKNGVPIDANDVLVNTSTVDFQGNPDVAMDEDGNFVIVWEGIGDQTGEQDFDDGVFLQAFQADGTPIGGEIRVNDTTSNVQSRAKIAMDYDGSSGGPTSFAVTWRGFVAGLNYNLHYKKYTVDFSQTVTPPTQTGGEIGLFTTADDEIPADIAMNNLGEYVILWTRTSVSGTDFFYIFFSQDDSFIGADTQLNAETGGAFPSVATDKMPRPSLDDPNDRHFIFTYGDAAANLYAVRIVCTDPDPLNGTDNDLVCSNAGKVIANDTSGTNINDPEVAADYLGNHTVTWSQNNSDGSGYGIVSQSYNYRGKRIGDNVNVNSVTANDQTLPQISMNTDGFYTISYLDGDTENHRFQNYVTEIFKVGNETLAHSAGADVQATSDIAVSPSGNIAMVWTDYTDDTIRLTLKSFDPSSNPPTYTTIVDSAVVSSGGSVDNPSVSFFKDTSGTGVNRFVVTWERTSIDRNVFYQLFDATGTADGSVTGIDPGAVQQTGANVAAGFYNPGGTGSGPAVEEFAVAWRENSGTVSIESAFNSSGFTYNQLAACTVCPTQRIGIDIQPSTTDTVFAWQDEAAGNTEAFIQQATGGTLTGSSLQASPAALDNGNPDIAFITNNDYIVTYTEVVSGTVTEVYGQTYEFGGGGPTNAGTRFNLSQFPATTQTEITTNVEGDTDNESFIVTWADIPTVTTDDFIFGQFFNYDDTAATNVTRFGPTFRINSTLSGNQGLPAVDMNEAGQVAVSWEGNYDQGGTTDANAVVHQLLQDPQNPLTVLELSPTAQQEVITGGTFLDVSATVTFPDVTLSTTADTTQTVSIRDPSFGGDVKYVEVQDASGADFTLSVQVGDFFSASDGKSYIKNDQHFRIKNWDNDLTDISNTGAGECDDANTPTDPTLCFETVESTVTPTAFSLSSATESFSFADTQVDLANKTGTTDQEIGRWRIYPEFEITVPPLIPPGAHNAEITFTVI